MMFPASYDIQFQRKIVQFSQQTLFVSFDMIDFCDLFRSFAVRNYTKSKIMQLRRRPLTIDELNANHYTVSVHKYAFFLCRKGTARILLGSDTYNISRNCLCIYTPNTFCQILEKSQDLEGILEEDDVDAYYPVIGSIDIRKRLHVRRSPCVEISDRQAVELVRLYEMTREDGDCHPGDDNVYGCTAETFRADGLRYLRYALCLKVLEVYFCNTPVEAMPQNRDDAILNRFLVSVYENCHRQRTVQYYADKQHLSPYYFSSIIRERSGKSALQWIGDITMIFSRRYLECSEMSIKEIADRMNFPDQSTFGRYFKHHEGCSPSEFRERRLRN